MSLLLLNACSQAGVNECEAATQAKLRSPSSYKRVGVSVVDINPANPGDLSHLTERWIDIDYDAVNGYNAPLRGKHHCRFALDQGNVGRLISDDEFGLQ